MATTVWASVGEGTARVALPRRSRAAGEPTTPAVRVTPCPQPLAPRMPMRLVLSTAASFLLHSVALACLSLVAPTASWRWIAVEPGAASVALQATMASAPPDGPCDPPAEIVFSAAPIRPLPPEESPLDRALADVAMDPIERQPAEDLTSLAQAQVPIETAADEAVKVVPTQRPAMREPSQEIPELSDTLVPLPRTDVGRRQREELPPGAELSYPTPASAPSEGAESKVPSIVVNPAPTYPAAPLAARQTGRTLLRGAVAPDGSVAELSVHRSSGVPALDGAAMNAVRRWKFTPAEGTSELRELLVPVRFVLEEP